MLETQGSEHHFNWDLFSLPAQTPITIFSKDPKGQNLPHTLLPPITQVHFTLNTMFTNYDPKASYNFKFSFPDSVFPGNEGNNTIKVDFHQNFSVQEDTFSSKLTQDQLSQIDKDGTFMVNSKVSTLKYKWKIHSLVFKGWETRESDWHTNLSRAYHQLRQIGKRLNGETLSIKLNLAELALYPARMGNMLVGLKQMSVLINPDYDRIIEMEFLLDKYNRFYFESKHQLYEYLYCPLEDDKHSSGRNNQQQRSQRLHSIDSSFDAKWEGVQRKLVRTYEKENEVLDQEYFSKFLANKKNDHYMKHLEENLDKKIATNVFELLKIFTVFELLKAEESEEMGKARTRVEERIRKQHKIKSLSYYFMTEELDKELEPIRKALRQEYLRKLKGRLDSKIYNQFLEHSKTFESRKIQLKQKIPLVYGPSRTFHSSYPLFPPYKVITNKLSNERFSYSLLKHTNTQVSTDHNFWKFSLYKMRVYTWSKTSFFYLVALAWVGPLGLKQLTTLGTFTYDQHIDSNTGEIKYIKHHSLYLQFLRVLKGISDSRRAFEALPDTGFFGKNLTRVFNYFECYVFRFLLVGVVWLLVAKPLLIVAYSLLSALLVVTMWVWLPVSLIVTYLFNVLIYQFEIDEFKLRQRRISQRWIPLLNTPLMLILNVLRVIAYLVGIVLVHPTGILFWLLFAIIARGWRTLTDQIMISIFKMMARTPARDTAVAWKVSGPGVSQNYSSTLTPEDVYMLVEAKLELMYLTSFEREMLLAINQPIAQIHKILTSVFSSFDCGYNCPIDVQRVNKQLSQNFLDQLQKFRRRFPTLMVSNVRFTKDQLDGYFQNSLRLVKHFVEKRKATWIFEENNCIPEDYECLAKNIWTNIFGAEIFEPLESLDSRFELQGQKSHNPAKEMVVRALEGQVKLERVTPSVTRSLKAFNIGYIPIPRAREVVDRVINLSSSYFPLSIHDDVYSVLFNRNIKELIERERRLKKYDRLYEQGSRVDAPK